MCGRCADYGSRLLSPVIKHAIEGSASRVAGICPRWRGGVSPDQEPVTAVLRLEEPLINYSMSLACRVSRERKQ